MESELDKNIKNNKQLNTVPPNSSYDKNKELLIQLLKEKLDTKLCRLEKRHKIQLTIMKLTTCEVEKITSWSFNACKQIKDKIKKDKEKQIMQSNQIKSKKKEKDTASTTGKISFLKTKTPLRTKTVKSFLDNTKTNINRNPKNKSLISSKTLKTLRTKSFNISTKDKKKTKY